MSPRSFFNLLVRQFSPRERQLWFSEGRAHVELRLADSRELLRVQELFQQRVVEDTTLLWAQVHQGTGRIVVAFQPGSFDEVQLLSLVTEVELLAGLESAPYEFEDHVTDQLLQERVLLELCADAAGLILGTALKFTILPRSRIAAALASALAVIRAVPRLRQPLEERLGIERTDLALSLSVSLLQAPAQRPLNALVGLLENVSLAGELRAQSQLFQRLEPRLFANETEDEPRPTFERAVPLPRGPIEEYSDRAWAVALGGFGVSFLTTRSVQRAFGALFGGLPRPAKLGREVYAAGLSRLFAQRQMLVQKRDALRRFDRVDCLVLQGALTPPGLARVGKIIVHEGQDESRLGERIHSLFDSEQPLASQQLSGWRLAPLGRADITIPEEMAHEASSLLSGGELVLALDRNDQLLALVEVRLQMRVGLEELVRSAHDASMKVVVASSDPDILQSIPADDTCGEGDELWQGVRRLQREGRTVCVVALGDHRAFDVADVSVSLVNEGGTAPWSADLVCRNDLTDVRILIESCRLARDVSRQSVNIALLAATVGSLASAGGLLPMTTGRVLTVVNFASLLSMGNGLRLSSELVRTPLPAPRDPTPWHALDARGVLSRLGSQMDGLTPAQALGRQRIRQNRKSALVRLSSAIGDELFNPLVPLLAAGAGLSAAVGGVADAAMVGGVVGLNAAVGGVQRFRTEGQIDHLSKAREGTINARRGGKVVEIKSEEVAVGDLLLFAPGDLVPADCRLLESRGLMIDSASLTGESLPVAEDAAASFEENIADRSSMIYQGTSITAGRAEAVVVAVGESTEARGGATTFRQGEAESGVEKRMRELMDWTAPIALAAGAGVIGAGLLRGRKMKELAGSAVSLAVASVPEGLPLLATAAQLAAARRLSQHGALVRNVRSLEALGRIDTICFDKTGTVTSGKVALSLVVDSVDGFDLGELNANQVRSEDIRKEALKRVKEHPRIAQLESLLRQALRASPLRPGDLSRTDPVEVALFRSADHLGIGVSEKEHAWQRLRDYEFDADLGYSASLGREETEPALSLKGAPESILELCSWSESSEGELVELGTTERDRWSQEIEKLANQGYRILAVARKSMRDEAADVEREAIDECVWLGLLAFRDPVRPKAAQAISELRRARIEPVIITGDHPSTARTVAAELGLNDEPNVMTGAELLRFDEDQLTQRVAQVDIFARVTPSQKVRIVRALGRSGRIVAMVGDGANDAAAIRLAQVGVAMGAHCAAGARNAADLVLTEPKIETLVQAIVEGRAMWDSVRDAVSILIGGNLGEIGFTLAGGLVAGRPPLSPRQLLLVNLFTDVAPATALALKAPEKSRLSALVESGPDASMGWRLDRDISARALVTATGAGAAWSLSSLLADRRGASTTALLALVGTQLGQTLTSGQRSRSVVVTSVVSTLALSALIQTPGLSRAFGCRPLGPVGWSIALGSSAAATLVGHRAPGWIEEILSQDSDDARQSVGTLLSRLNRLRAAEAVSR